MNTLIKEKNNFTLRWNSFMKTNRAITARNASRPVRRIYST